MSARIQAYKILQLFRHVMHREVIEQVHFGKRGQIALTFDDGYGDMALLLNLQSATIYRKIYSAVIR